MGLSSQVMVILLNFQRIAGYYEKYFDKKFLPDNLSNNRPHSLYYILKLSDQTNGSLPR
jgi:hypothetical protein